LKTGARHVRIWTVGTGLWDSVPRWIVLASVRTNTHQVSQAIGSKHLAVGNYHDRIVS